MTFIARAKFSLLGFRRARRVPNAAGAVHGEALRLGNDSEQRLRLRDLLLATARRPVLRRFGTAARECDAKQTNDAHHPPFDSRPTHAFAGKVAFHRLVRNTEPNGSAFKN